MKYKRSYIKILITLLLLSCGPKQDNSDQYQDNSFKIQDLTAQLKELHEELKTLQTQNKSSGVDTSHFATKEELQALRAESHQMSERILNLIHDKISEQENKYSELKKYIDDTNNKYVKISDFQILTKKIEDNYALKSDVLQIQMEQSTTKEEIKLFKEEYTKHVSAYSQQQREAKEYLEKSLNLWSERLVLYINESDSSLSKKLEEYISNEISRIKVQQESILERLEGVLAKKIQFEKDLEQLKENQGRAQTNEYSQVVIKNYDEQINELKESLKTTQQHLENVNEKIAGSNISQPGSIVDDITKKMFSACYKSLKDDPYCFTTGTLIQKLGGIFLDPTKFKRTQKDFIRYLTLSGVENKNIINKTQSFLIPDPNNRDVFNSCHGNEDLEGLIPPTKLWPRGLFLSLIFEKITIDLNKQSELGLVAKDIKPFLKITSWWRSRCYHEKITGNKESDHIYASAFDPIFENHQSFEFYKDYAFNNIWQNDIFDIRYPLESVDFGFSIGIGHGNGRHGNGKMHLGVGSPLKGNGQLRQWRY